MLVTVTILDGALGFSAGPPKGHVKIGVSTAGTVNELVSWTDGQQAKDSHTSGPLVESSAFSLANGGQPVYGMRVNASVLGTASSVTTTLQAGSDGALATTGSSPLDRYDVVVLMTRDGKVGVAPYPAFRYSIDGTDNYSEEIAVPVGGTYVIPGTGVTLVFSNGVTGFKKDDKFTFTTTAPSYSNTDLQNAFTALKADTRKWEFVHVLGAANAATAAVAQTFVNEMRANGRFVWVLLEARDIGDGVPGETEDQWITALSSNYDSFTSPFGQVTVSAGYCELTSAVSGRLYRRPQAWTVAARASAVPFQRDLGRVKDGPLAGIAKNALNVSVYHDERVKPGLETARFLTVQSIIGKQGFFVGGPAKRSPSTMASLTSDYSLLQNVRVILYAAATCLEQGTDLLGDEIETNADGTIQERKDVEIENTLTSRLSDLVVGPGYAVRIKAQLNRSINLLTTKTVRIKVLVRPFGYAKEIAFELGFENPNLKTVLAVA